MGSNFAARAATAPELVNFRSPGQWSRLGLAFQHPQTVYTARINQTFATLDGVAELTYDGGAGTLTDVLAGMTIFIGSSASDKGICRVRKLPTSTTLYINPISDIQFADDDYLTIIDSFSIWQRDISMTGGIVRMDYDIEFGDYRNGRILPRIAPLVAVLHLADGVDGVVTFTPPDPTLSDCYDGATVVSYQYDAPGAASTADMDTDAPSWSYDEAGEYRWSCTITDSNGAETVSQRWVYVDPEKIPFKLEDCSGDVDSGNWSLTVRCLADVAKSLVHDRAMVTLYGVDYYDSTTKDAVGRIEGYENIYCSGWVDLEENDFDSETGEVIFTIYGPAHWLSKIRAFPLELLDTSIAPTNWKEITEMDVDKALAFLLIWTSTAPMVMDCFLTGITTREKIFAEPSGSLLDQINAIAGKVFATALVNSLGQMYVEVDPQMMASADRDALPVVMDITKADRLDSLNLERSTSAKTSMVELSGWAYDGTLRSQVFSRAPGNTPKTFGGPDAYDDFIIADQAECNRIAGCVLAALNNEFEPLEISFSANNRLFDICPRMYATITILAADNPRGIEVISARLIPRKVEFAPDEDSISVLTKVTFEFEAVSIDGVTYYPPVVEDGFDDYQLNEPSDMDFPNAGLGSWMPDTVPSTGLSGPCGGAFNAYTAGWDKSELRGESDDRIARIYFPCRVRPKSYNTASPSKVVVGGHAYGDAVGHLHLYGIKGGARVITADSNFEFDPGAPVEVDGFELELDAGLGTIVTYVPLDVIDSGTVAADNGTGIPVTTVSGQYYAVTGSGYWWSGIANSYGCTFNGLSALLTEKLGGPSQRYYFQANSTIHNVTVADYQFWDNTGSSAYNVRNARADGRRITFGSATVQNVCAVG